MDGCPTEEELLAFAQGGLAAEEAGGVEAHIADCDDCRVVIAEGARALAADAGEPSAADDWVPPEVRRGARIGRYTVLETLGEGAAGRVYVAHDPLIDRRVAVKVLRQPVHLPEERLAERFVREAMILRDLADTHIVRYLDHGYTEDKQLYLAMECLDGESLASRLVGGPLDAGETLGLARDLAGALAAAHERGVVHRDVKPANVFLVDGRLDRAKLLDFGVARLAREGRGLTRSGDLLGTPLYMSPEQVRGESQIGPAADVWALGCLLFQCLAGRIPFGGGHLTSVMANILYADAPHVRELAPAVPAALDDLLARMLAKDAGDRPADGGALVAELDAIGAVQTVAAGPRAGTPSPVAPAEGLTTGELRLHTAVILASAPSASAEVARAHGGRLERLLNGAGVVTFPARELPAVRVRTAALCAEALRRAVPRTPIAIATWRGSISARWPLGEVIDAALRRPSSPGAPIGVDELSARLLGSGWDVPRDGAGRTLGGRRDPFARGRPFVGRERELATLQHVADECFHDSGARTILVTGAPGVGKSRVAGELVARLCEREPDLRVWRGGGDPLRASVPRSLLAAFGDLPGSGWLDGLAAACAGGPLLVLVEDLQWADRESVQLLDTALHDLRDRPLLVLALAQSEIFEQFPKLWHERGLTHVALGELPRRAAERLARDALGEGDPTLVARVVERAGGNPLFLEELCRSAAEGGGDAFPETVLGVAQARLARLSVETRRALRAASVFGVAFWAGGVAALLGGGIKQGRLLEQLAHAAERDILSPRPATRFPGESEHAFRHAYLRDAAYAALTRADRLRGHRLAGRWLAERGDRDAAAAHFEAGAAAAALASLRR